MEIKRLETQLASATDKNIVTYVIARTFASAKQWPETMTWLRKVAELKAGLDPSRDSVFWELRNTREFAEILSEVRAATPMVSRSHPAFMVAEGDLVPESIAYDPKHRRFFLGSMRKGKILQCLSSGECTDSVGRLDTVLGLKVNGNRLWILNNSAKESALIGYDLASMRMVIKRAITGGGHNFNDLVIARAGDIYITDTAAGAVWHLEKGSLDLTRISGNFESANGITLSPDSSLLYVSTYPGGITVVNLRTHEFTSIAHPGDLCLAAIDGLYFHRGALVAVQNGFMTPPIIRLSLTRDLRAVKRVDVLERRNPLFDGITTGVVVGRRFFYMANIQDEKKDAFIPIMILKLHL